MSSAAKYRAKYRATEAGRATARRGSARQRERLRAANPPCGRCGKRLTKRGARMCVACVNAVRHAMKYGDDYDRTMPGLGIGGVGAGRTW